VLPALVLSIAASVEIRIEDSRGVSSDDGAAILAALREAIDDRTNDPGGEGLRPTDVVLVRLIGVPTRIRLIAERRGAREAHSEVDLSRAKGSWSTSLAGVAKELFPEEPLPPPVAPPPPLVPPPLPPEEPSLAPWIVVGAGAVALAVGAGFGFSSRGARSSAANEPHTPEELADLEDRAIGHGIAANVLFGVGAAGVAGGLIWWLLD
jgi:hypothetical protein